MYQTVRVILKSSVRKERGLQQLLTIFQESVNQAIHFAIRNTITSYARLRKGIYDDWKQDYPTLPTHYCHSACRIASQVLRSWRNHCRKKQASWNHPPHYHRQTMKLEDRLCRVRISPQGNFIIVVKAPACQEICFPIVLHKQIHKNHFDLTRHGEISIGWHHGQLVAFIPVRVSLPINTTSKTNVIGLDLNERSVDLCYYQENFAQSNFHQVDASRLPAIRHAMQLKRQRIQQKLATNSYHPARKNRLLEKYREREQHRTTQELHLVVNEVLNHVPRDSTVILEDLTRIRDSFRSKKKSHTNRGLRKPLRRRLNQWAFRQFQAILTYKAAHKGIHTEVVSGKYTSQICPICGTQKKLKGHEYRCQTCGLETSRHFVGAYNVAYRYLHGKLPHPPKHVGSSLPTSQEVDKRTVPPERSQMIVTGELLGATTNQSLEREEDYRIL